MTAIDDYLDYVGFNPNFGLQETRDRLLALVNKAVSEAYEKGFAEARMDCAKRLHELGEEKYPRDVFKDRVGKFARHLLEDVLPEEIRALKPKGSEE